MSEERDLNPSDSPDPARAEMESLLRELVPQPLGVNRDLLFFEAGQAAANRANKMQRFWPAVAAVLLVACGGLSAALARKSTNLDAALAAVAQPDGGAEQGSVATADENPTANEPTIFANRTRTNGRRPSQDIDEMLLLDRPRGDQLTAQVWVKDGPHNAATQNAATQNAATQNAATQNTAFDEPRSNWPEELPLRPTRRSDYLELMRGLGG